MKRSTLDDVAKLANVGIATVDRVLNERGNVSALTAAKVIAAAEELGLRRILPAIYRSGIRVEVALAQRTAPFIKRLNSAFIRAASTLDRSVTIHRNFYDGWTPQKIAARLKANSNNGLIIYGHEDPEIKQVIDELSEAGIPVVTIVSDLPQTQRRAYVGVNNFSAGRTAAFFLSRMAHQSGDIIVLCHSFRYRGHMERVTGFESGLREYGKNLRLCEVLEGNDDISLSGRLLDKAIRQCPNLVGIYNAGGANRAVEQALTSSRLAGKVLFFGHELTDVTVRLLRSGTMTMTIDQNPEMEARHAIETMLHSIARPSEVTTRSAMAYVPFTVHTVDSIPEGFSEDAPTLY
ncbi:substrate-binding domain-containing protein [Phyllobacterium sp. LjRoot231]|uniref:LacI family DNA-binding transcriptional regulator n=1 Tax=Phyllobacterium sp. LjRoot231 TaxID=3342289 RepID=UPI003ECD0CB6